MNKVILMGRLARDPELQTTPQGTPVCRFTIAVDRRFSKDGQRQADFISCTAWRQQAEFICKWFKKGSMISVVGNIQTRSWDGQDGKKQFATDVVIDEAYFTGSKAESGTAAPDFSQNTAPAQPPSGNDAPFDDFDSMGFAAMGGSEDDLPF
jgi:single-strand DNA-binding protein